jgi:aryl sulfotransferase
MPRLVRPQTREVREPIIDSHRWDDFQPRDGDVVVATFAKCGTTWTQRIVDLLIFQSPDPRPVGAMAPWLDSTVFAEPGEDVAKLAAQTHRRHMKSHLPFDALPVWDTVKYIHTGRDGRDACLSFHNHMLGTRADFGMRLGAQAMAMAAAGRPPRPHSPTPQDPHDFVLNWLEELEHFEPAVALQDPTFFEFEQTYWDQRHRPNLLLVHYNDMKEDLAGEMRRISDFLEIDTPDSLLPDLVKAASFDSMKASGDALMPQLREAFDRGADRFIHQGKSGRWKDVFTEEDLARYEAIVARWPTPPLAAWLAGGRRGAGDPRAAAD